MRAQTRLKNVIIIVGLVVCLPFTWVVVFTGPDVSVEELLEKRLAEMRDRLQHAESLNRERNADIMSLRNQINVFMRGHKHGNASESGSDVYLPQEARELLANLTLGGTDLQPPSMFHYLPHLIGKPHGLQPAVKLAKGRMGVSVALAIPTIKRERESYLFQTLESLIDGLSDAEKNDCVIIVFIGEPDEIDYVKTVAAEIQKRFATSLASGLLEVISPPAAYYPNMNNLKETFGDPLERVKWRTKQNLDFSFLMMYAQAKATYYCQLEDDIVTKSGYLSIMKSFALNQKTEDWMLLEFSHLGFIGKMFKSSDLPMVVEFFLMFHRDKPIDWLLDHLLYVKVCNPERDNWHCEEDRRLFIGVFRPSLFVLQQNGTRGPYPHNLLPLWLEEDARNYSQIYDKDFGKATLHHAHFNPTAEVSTSIKVYQHYSMDRAYMGETFFWGLIPEEGNMVNIKFQPPIRIEKFLFRSGNPEHPGDKFFNTTVEVLPHSSAGAVLNNNNNNNEPGHNKKDSAQAMLTNGYVTKDGYVVVGRFDVVTGTAEGEVDMTMGEIHTLRLHVLSTSETWVIVNEIMIKERKDR